MKRRSLQEIESKLEEHIEEIGREIATSAQKVAELEQFQAGLRSALEIVQERPEEKGESEKLKRATAEATAL